MFLATTNNANCSSSSWWFSLYKQPYSSWVFRIFVLPATYQISIFDAVSTRQDAETTPILTHGQNGGKDKKIISFSLFSGKFREPLPQWLDKGVFANIEGCHFYFPDW